MSSIATGKDVSQVSGDIYFIAYKKLVKQKEKIDREISKLQGSLIKAMSSKKGILLSPRIKYVARSKNTTTLAKAIRKSMIPNKKMTMEEILKSLSEKGLYNTRSKYFYTMVNNKLHLDKRVKTVSRGIFLYVPRGKRKVGAA